MEPQGLDILATAERLKLDPSLKKRISKFEALYAIDKEMRPFIERIILNEAEKHGHKILLPYPSARDSQGDYPIGMVHSGRDLFPFCIQKLELLRHVEIYGGSGAGKTVAGDAILWNLLKDDVPTIIFDYDGSHKHLLSRPEGKNLLYLTPGSDLCPFPFNPHITHPDFSFTKKIAYLFEYYDSLVSRHVRAESTLTIDGVHDLLMRFAQEFIGEGEDSFTLKQIYQRTINCRDLREEEKRWRVTLKDVLQRFTSGPLNSVFNTKSHIPPETFFERQTLISLDAFTNSKQKADFVESFLYSLLHNYLKRKKPVDSGRKKELRLAIFIEEIHHIKHSILEELFQQVRKWGVSITFTAQNPSRLPQEIRNNTYAMLVQNLKAPEDKNLIADTLLLTRKNLPYLGSEADYVSLLGAGEGVYLAKIQGRLKQCKTFPLHIYPLPKLKEIDDLNLKKRMLPFYQERKINPDDVEFSGELQHIEPDEVEIGRVVEGLPDRAKKLLFDVAQNPLSKVRERYERLGYNADTAKRKLIELGLIEQRAVANGKGQVVLFILTMKGEQALDYFSFNNKPDKPDLSAGLGHEWIKEETAWKLEAMGFENVQMEKRILLDGDRDRKMRMDVHAEKRGKKIAFQVESGKSTVLKNILMPLKHGYNFVISVALDKATKEMIRERIKGLQKDIRELEFRVFVIGQWEVEDTIKLLEKIL